MKIEVVHLYTGDDDESHFEDQVIELEEAKPGRWVSPLVHNSGAEFASTPSGSTLGWHNAPCRQYVITLSGHVELETRTGEQHVLRSGDVLLAADVSGGGHRWRLLGDEPWRRVYVRLDTRAE